MLLLKKSSIVMAAALSVSMHFQAATALGAYFCNDINWTNDCAHWKDLVPYRCYTLDAGHQDKVSSFGPDSGTACTVFSDYHCTSSSVTIENPGSGDLRNVNYPEAPVNGPGSVNDNMNSFECFAS
ncbi:hypothetical protein FB451DRAFT_1394196 [Mycena latifolia]|nr:hypothetical protein FB451DRAFT_1394196 [Mycena latifolia]